MALNSRAHGFSQRVFGLVKPTYQQQACQRRGMQDQVKGVKQLRHSFVAREPAYEAHNGCFIRDAQLLPHLIRTR